MKYLPFVLFFGCVAPLETLYDIAPIHARVEFLSGLRPQEVFIVAVDKKDIHVRLPVDSTFGTIRVVPRPTIKAIKDMDGNDITESLLYRYDLLAQKSLEKLAEAQVRSYNLQVVVLLISVVSTIALFLN